MGKRILTETRRVYLRWKISELRRKLKLKCLEYKGGKCSNCGYSKCVNSLSFHHLNPDEKDFEISKFKTKVFNNLKPELDKCILLCFNCHAEEHERLRDLNRVIDDTARSQIFIKRKTNKEKAISYKGGKCNNCGYNKNISSLCFHHLIPEQKSFGITAENLTKTWSKIEQELNKCALLCLNCHGEEHNKEHQQQKIDKEKSVRALVPKQERDKRSTLKACATCSKQISVYPSRDTANNFCSRKCRDLKMNNEGWISDEELLSLAEKIGAKQVAKNLGKSNSSTYARIAAIKKRKNQ
jgi:endogenous inhibitor of DNA gyrase (YacG/DUF329 family)